MGMGNDLWSGFLGKRNPQGCSHGPHDYPRNWAQQLHGDLGFHGMQLIPAGSSFGMLHARSSLERGDPKKGLLGFRDRSGTMGAAADAEWLRWVSKKFGNVAGKEKEISLEEFKSALQVKEVRDPWEEGMGSVGRGNGIHEKEGTDQWEFPDPWEHSRFSAP